MTNRTSTRMAELSHEDRMQLLRFAASFLWADHEMHDREREFFEDLAHELAIDDAARTEVRTLLDCPPAAELVDPFTVPPRVAGSVRQVALRAIAADGRVAREEMKLFHLLDALLPS